MTLACSRIGVTLTKLGEVRQGAGGTVLLVEDDTELRAALSDMLAELGYEVASAADGKEALAYLRSSPVKPRLILLDLIMPRMDGRQFRREQLRDPALAPIPVVVLTGDPTASDLRTAIGAVRLLAKPPRFLELLDAIEACCPESQRV